MAIATGTLYEMHSTATTGNTGGALFNTANANFLTDGAATSANTSAPVFTTATYNFVAGDVGAYIYVKAGTNSIPGMYQIASVAANAATLSAAIGSGEVLDANTGMWKPSTAVGIATTASPTGLTFGVDYSRLDAAKTTATDFTAVGASTTMSSATASFTPVMVGNGFHQTTTGTGAFGVVGWYEIVSYTNATTVVTDRTTNSGTTSVACTGFVGGAGRLNGLEDAFYEQIPLSGMVFYKGSGSHAVSAAISIANTNPTAVGPNFNIGYSSVRGDACNTSSRPTIAMGANNITFGTNMNFINFIMTGSGTNVLGMGTGGWAENCAVFNTSSTAARAACNITTDCHIRNCEAVSQNGNATTGSTRTKILYSYMHHSNNGSTSATSGGVVIGCLVEGCVTAGLAFTAATGSNTVQACTIYGREAKIGTGVNLASTSNGNNCVNNNIIYGCATGVAVLTNQNNSNASGYNDFFNNTADTALFAKMPSDLAVDPVFTGATQITGTTGSGSGSVITDTNANFSTVTDNVDYVYQISGTGATVGMYLITAHTTTTLTCNNTVGTNATADRSYVVWTGHNFAIGTALKAAGIPTTFGGSETTAYQDIGGVQRQEAGSGGTSRARVQRGM